MTTPARIFTVEEADSLVEDLEMRLARIQGKKAACERFHDELFMHELLTQADPRSSGYDPGKALDAEAQSLEGLLADLEAEIESLRQTGCILRSLERGWIDFPARREGGLVYLCWHRGEPRVRYYHSLRSPAAERLVLEKKT